MAVATPGEFTQRLREFSFSDEDFEALRRLVKELIGINLSDQKRELVYGRLARRLRALNLRSFREYRKLLAEPNSQELVEFCNAITTNLTSFFREPHHFEYLHDAVLRPLADMPPGARRLRIWSAGCSSGEEPYSIAMTVLEALGDVPAWDIRILATDVDSAVLERARRGVYGADRVRNLDPRRLERFFTEQRGGSEPTYTIRPEVARLVVFRHLNLMHPLPMRGPLDVIFCRNVIIYFDRDTQRDLFARIAPLQRPGHLLFLGHSESLFKVSDDYEPLGRTMYRRI